MADDKKAVSTASGTESPAPEAVLEKYTMKQHWKCLAACTLMSLCPFQYGIDFGLIGGMQAMVGFLRVCPPLSGTLDIPTDTPFDRFSDTKTPTSPADGTSRLSASS